MNDQSSLVSACLRSPEDETPRRIYADWLEENQEGSLAEFIRIQAELHDISSKTKALLERKKQLMDDGVLKKLPVASALVPISQNFGSITAGTITSPSFRAAITNFHVNCINGTIESDVHSLFMSMTLVPKLDATQEMRAYYATQPMTSGPLNSDQMHLGLNQKQNGRLVYRAYGFDINVICLEGFVPDHMLDWNIFALLTG